MKKVEDFKWVEGMSARELVDKISRIGFQGAEIGKAIQTIKNMKDANSKIYLTFTSNMVTSGLRGLFAQTIQKGMANVVITTVGGIEEDLMKSYGEEFLLGSFNADDVQLKKDGLNRVGNVLIKNESYQKFENIIKEQLETLYAKKKEWTPSEMFKEIGLTLKDEDSILYQAAKNNVPIFCPAITDGAFGFHLYLFQQEHSGFKIDVVKEFENVLLSTDQNEKKGLISLGGGVSKHHAILSCLLNGGMDFVVYLTTARAYSGSLSGATTQEAKSWGKIKGDGDAAMVIGDVSIIFPLIMSQVFEGI
jgi:deoxyhypusine synthase